MVDQLSTTLEREATDHAEQSRSLPYYPQLDGLRAIAIIAVMIGHFSPNAALNNIFGYGDTGVVLFFCLSGFLITGILLDMRRQEQTLPSKLGIFYSRRVLRIFPTYYLTVAVAIAAGYEPVSSNLWRLVSYTVNYVPGLPVVTGLGQASHLWSLSVEEQFYLAWPAVVFLTPEKHLRRMFVLTITASVAMKYLGALNGSSYSILFRSVFSCMDSLGAGALLAFLRPALPILWRDFGAVATKGAAILLMSLTATRIFSGVDPWYHDHEIFGIAYFHSVVLLSITLIAGATNSAPWLLGRFLSSKVLVSIGKISYGLYVYHFFMPEVATFILPSAICGPFRY